MIKLKWMQPESLLVFGCAQIAINAGTLDACPFLPPNWTEMIKEHIKCDFSLALSTTNHY